jgi:hypothetical protein
MTARGAQDGRTALQIANTYSETDVVELLTRAAVRAGAIALASHGVHGVIARECAFLSACRFGHLAHNVCVDAGIPCLLCGAGFWGELRACALGVFRALMACLRADGMLVA